MNSNLKLLPATLLVAVLALAGCGGGGSDDMTPDPMPTPTPEEQCTADGGIYEDGECKSADDLRNEGAEAEKEAEAAKARLALAKKLHGLLSPAAVTVPSNTAPTEATVTPLLSDARRDGMAEDDNAMVMVMNTQGDGRQVDMPTGSTTRNLDNTLLTALTNARHIMGSGFATGANEVLNHNDIKGEGDREVRGSYMGAMGVFVCADTSDDCTSQRTDNGIKLTSAAGWTFTPDTGQKYTVPDAAYAEYGWWINEDIAADPKVGAWYFGNGAALADVDIAAATGSATYTGTAIGQAAYYHSQGGDLNVGGAFTADAELMATFGASPMLGGTIDNFDVGGMQPDWVVKLNKTPLAAGTGATTPDGTNPENSTVWTIDGTDGAALASAWEARLYDLPSGAHQPTGVAGGFKAQYDSDGYMVGAFGAEQ